MCPPSNVERSRATRERLVAAARRLFAEQGYEATTLAQVSSAAKVSTGALYHHWTGKEQLLVAVLTATHHDVASRVAAAVEVEDDPLGQLRRSAEVFLQECARPEVGRVLLVEAPAVLGETWHELDRRWWHRPTADLLRAAAERGQVRSTEADGVARALLGALTALGRGIADGDDRPEAALDTLGILLDGLRSPPSD